MSRSSKTVLVTAEKLVEDHIFTDQPEMTLIPYFMVEAFSIVPQGAWPGSCWPDYEIDYPAVEEYMSSLSQEVLDAHLKAASKKLELINA